MKLLSLRLLLNGAGHALRRFPLTLLCGLVLGGISVHLIHAEYKAAYPDWVFAGFSTAGLGLTLTLAAALVAERYRWPAAGRWGGQAAAVALLASWYASVPALPGVVWGTRLALLLLGLHLLVAVGPYLAELRYRADTPGFWRYNETLFLRILTAGLYSGVLYAGCGLALLAIENLFAVKLDSRVYADLLVGLATVFATWFFLAGVPHKWEALEQAAPYPRGLKLFTQFVLLPLVVLYLAILYAYMGRILVLWALPKGWVSMLVLALAVAGIFALLLIHPIRHAAENAWLRTFARWFYRALFPLLALLAVAIGTRIRTYGITEERYLVLVLAAWLFGIAVYFLLRRGQGIIWLPTSLALVAFLSSAGPWGAFAVAQRSQLRQLERLSAQYGLLRQGHLDAAGQRVPGLPLAARQRITSIFDFFADREATAQLQPLFARSLALPDSLRTRPRWRQRAWHGPQLFALSALPRTNQYGATEEPEEEVSFTVLRSEVQALGGGRYWIDYLPGNRYQYQNNNALVEITALEGNFRLRPHAQGRHLVLEQQRADGGWQTQLTLHPGALADSLARRTTQPSTELAARTLTLRAATKRATLRVFFRNLTRHQKRDSVYYDFNAQALVELTAE